LPQESFKVEKKGRTDWTYLVKRSTTPSSLRQKERADRPIKKTSLLISKKFLEWFQNGIGSFLRNVLTILKNKNKYCMQGLLSYEAVDNLLCKNYFKNIAALNKCSCLSGRLGLLKQAVAQNLHLLTCFEVTAITLDITA
jgi:hypothetical protein